MRADRVVRYAPRAGARHALRQARVITRRTLRRAALLALGCAMAWLLAAP